MYVGQGSTIPFAASCMSFLDSLFFPGELFRQIESMNVGGVSLEAGDADSRVCTRSQV